MREVWNGVYGIWWSVKFVWSMKHGCVVCGMLYVCACVVVWE